MLTEEQIKKLKPGDPLIFSGTFLRVDKDGYIWVNVEGDYIYFSPACVSLHSEYKTVVDAIDIFRNMSEGEKASINNFLASYFRETKKQEKMRNALKKMGISLTPEKPKYDPCRKFKKGDIVDYRRRDGRDYETVPDSEDYKFARVLDSEDDESGMVGVEFVAAYGGDDAYFLVPWYHLQLVTPVEELEPYSVHESEVARCFDIMREKLCVMSFPFGSKETGYYHDEPAAKAAAEAERDRLNEEWRKEQS